MVEVRDPAEKRSVVAEATAVTAADRGSVLARCADLSRARAEERGASGPQFYTWVKTAAVRYQW